MTTPYRCPVCNGTGLVPNGFYRSIEGSRNTNSVEPEKCRSCNGTGIVWNYTNGWGSLPPVMLPYKPTIVNPNHTGDPVPPENPAICEIDGTDL